MSALADLVHDVGKHIARAARNMREASPALIAMLVKDLYAIDGTRRASEVFAALRARIEGDDPRFDEIAAKLAEIDELESAVRAGEGSAVMRASALALDVEALVRAIGKKR